ncbi:MAG: histidine kinase [Planctomycetaceae bacterium]|nr:histidine kinase [Planctomycetaceae bacterium]
MQTLPTVVLIHDDDHFCQSTATLVSSVGLRIVRLASGGIYLRDFGAGHSGCVVIDLGKPKLEGMQLLEELFRSPLRSPVIGIVSHVDVSTVIRALRHGVSAVLQIQHASNTELLDAIQAAIAKDARQRASHSRGEEIQSLFDSLSATEWAVLELLMHGDELTVVAEKLEVSRRTVESRRARVMNKLGVKSFTALVALLLEQGHFHDDA